MGFQTHETRKNCWGHNTHLLGFPAGIAAQGARSALSCEGSFTLKQGNAKTHSLIPMFPLWLGGLW